jgi:transposase
MDDRIVLEGVLWILRTGSPWRDLPSVFGVWETVYCRFRRWARSGLFASILAELTDSQADREYVMVDSTSIRVHQDGARSHDPFAHALGYPLGFILTGGERGDATQAMGLLRKYMQPKSFALMDCGYDSDAIRNFVVQEGGIAVIPQNPTRAGVLPFDKHLYKERHKVENLFQKLKRFRRIASRYEIKPALFAGMISLACICLWILA